MTIMFVVQEGSQLLGSLRGHTVLRVCIQVLVVICNNMYCRVTYLVTRPRRGTLRLRMLRPRFILAGAVFRLLLNARFAQPCPHCTIIVAWVVDTKPSHLTKYVIVVPHSSKAKRVSNETSLCPTASDLATLWTIQWISQS